MKLTYHGATSMRSDLQTDILASARAGFKALELEDQKIDNYLKDHSLSDLKKLLDSNHIEPASINSVEFIGFQGEAYPKIQAYCLKLSQFAEAIGCKALVTVPSPTPQTLDGKPVIFVPWDRVVAEYVTVLQDLSAIAKPFGVKLAFEFLGFGWCTVRTPRGAYEIVKRTVRDNVGMNFDTCHFYGGGGLLSEMDEVDARKIITFHINDLEDVPKEAITDAVRLLPGSGVIPLADICKKMKSIGYNGNCTVELFRPEYWDWDPYELAKKSYEATLKIIAPFFSIE
jgi:2-keto-myo-inositol isomerase